MKNLQDLYNLITKENIKLKEVDFKETGLKGLCITNLTNCNIYLDKHLNTSVEKKCVLAEEIGHYKKGICFNLLNNTEDNVITRSINEFRAKKWAVNELIPFKQFKRFLDTNYTKFEVANELGVTEEMLDMAYFIYEPMLYEERT